jgi:group II intron reverse transcriptase/maturase
LGIAALEDKIAQKAVAKVLNAIYEVDFLGFSYGFRPGRHPHRALDALAYCLIRKKVNWVLDADIRGYFDSIDHELLMSFVERRIGDTRILRLLRKWLNAGVLEDDTLKTAKEGTPQGATISPLLANIFLHYVFDVWAHDWRQRYARGELYIVRYADDFVVGFQFRAEAERFLRALKERLTEFRLELHPGKTRLLEFGRFASKTRTQRGQGKPETFDFLGFTHICGVSRKGGFLLRRHTSSKRWRIKLKSIRQQLRWRMHSPPKEVGEWLRKVLNGYFNYHAVPTNRHRMSRFRQEVAKAWLTMRQRRSDRDRSTWERFAAVVEHWLPSPEYRHPFPEVRMQSRLT